MFFWNDFFLQINSYIYLKRRVSMFLKVLFAFLTSLFLFIPGYSQDSLGIINSIEKLKKHHRLQPGEMVIIVDPSIQKLFLFKDDSVMKIYSISTAKAGLGSEQGSEKTPVGTHRIREKHGHGAEKGAIFKARVHTGRISEIYSEKIVVPVDYVTTRIMWLEGQEFGINKGGKQDSYKRCIYIHGTHEEGLIGEPASHGCIRMRNEDVIELFNLVPTNTLVEILGKDFSKK